MATIRTTSLGAQDLLRNWRREAQMAAVYSSLAGAAKEGGLRGRLNRLAEVEDRHAEAWAACVREAGLQVPGRTPRAAALAAGALARVAGMGPALGLAGMAEGKILRVYLAQIGGSQGRPREVLRALIPEESEHSSPGAAPGDRGAAEDWHGGGVESIRNVIYGLNDGLTATLGVLAGVGGATVDPHVVLVGGLAAMVASGVSMAGGAYLATKSQREIYEDQLAREAAEIEAMPELERAELKEIYMSKGLTASEAETIVARITQDKDVWLETQAREELGLDASQFENPVRESVVAGVATLLGGLVPVLGYLLARAVLGGNHIGALVLTFAICIAFLFLMGTARSLFTGKSGLRSGVEMMAVGTVVALVTYFVGVFFKQA